MGRHINKGGSQLARETGLNVMTVCQMQKKGMTPDQIRARGAELMAQRAKGKRLPTESMRIASVATTVSAAVTAAIKAALPESVASSYAPPRTVVSGLMAAAKRAALAVKIDADADADSGADDTYETDFEADGSDVLTLRSNGSTASNGYGEGQLESHIQADRRKAIALANERELKVAQLRGELVPVAMANAWFGRQIVQCRDSMLKIGPELRDRLAAESDPVKCEQMVDQEVKRALDALKQMEGVVV